MNSRIHLQGIRTCSPATAPQELRSDVFSQLWEFFALVNSETQGV